MGDMSDPGNGINSSLSKTAWKDGSITPPLILEKQLSPKPGRGCVSRWVGGRAEA